MTRVFFSRCLVLQKISPKKYLFPCGDYPSQVVDKFREQLEDYFYVPGIAIGYLPLEKLAEKSTMISKAFNAGFVIPKTMICDFSSASQNSGTFCEYFHGSYPLLIRPCGGEESSFNRFMVVEDESQLINAFININYGKAIIQEYISKDEEIGIQGVGFGDDVLDPIVTGIIHKIRTSLVSPGSTTYATIRSVDDTEPINECNRFIKENGYSGIFDIELLRKDNRYYFIECNFRNGAYGYSYTCSGHNLPLIWINKSDNSECAKKELKLMNEFGDIKHIKKKNISWFGWLRQFVGADIHLTLNRRDLRPFLYRLISSCIL